MSTYFTLLTKVGIAKITNAMALSTTVNWSQMVIGDGNGNVTVPNENQTQLVREVFRGPINHLYKDPSNSAYVIAELVIPASVGGWTAREAGIIDTEGNLVAVANLASSYKPTLPEGSGVDLVVRMVVQVGNTSSVELKIDPSIVLATRQFVTLEIDNHNKSQESHKQLFDSKLSKDKNGQDIQDKNLFLSNISDNRIKIEPLETRILSPDKQSYIFIQNEAFGFYSLKQPAGNLALGIAFGGTGAKDAQSARSNLGLGNSATRNVGTSPGSVAAGDDSRIVNSVQRGEFTSGAGWVRFPDGTIIQRGISISGSVGYPKAISLPIPFTTEFTVVATFDSATSGATDCPSFATTKIGLSGFYLMSSRVGEVVGAGANWIAIGK